MRDKILETLCAHDQDKYGVDMSGKRKINVERAADELTALMCYREVSAMYLTYKSERGNPFYPDSAFILIKHRLTPDYSEQTIMEAIEKVKNEQK